MHPDHKILPSRKWGFALFLAILIPSYWMAYGPSNFLWYSDIILFLTFFATIFESRFLASMAASGGLAFCLLWILSVFYAIIFGTDHHMLDTSTPIWIRSLSFFHIALVFVLIGLLQKLGYQSKAWIYQIVLTWMLAFTTWLVTDKAENINFVFNYEQWGLHPFPYLVGLATAASFLIFSTHLLLTLFCKNK